MSRSYFSVIVHLIACALLSSHFMSVFLRHKQHKFYKLTPCLERATLCFKFKLYVFRSITYHRTPTRVPSWWLRPVLVEPRPGDLCAFLVTSSSAYRTPTCEPSRCLRPILTEHRPADLPALALRPIRIQITICRPSGQTAKLTCTESGSDFDRSNCQIEQRSLYLPGHGTASLPDRFPTCQFV